jgi:hypothetical protein
VLSTPPAFVLSQNQTLQTKTPSRNPAEFESEQSDLTKRHQKLASQKQNHTPTREARMQSQNKQQQNKTTKHTIEFSNNTRRPRSKTRGFWPLARSTDVEGSHRNGFPSGMPPRSPD